MTGDGTSEGIDVLPIFRSAEAHTPGAARTCRRKEEVGSAKGEESKKGKAAVLKLILLRRRGRGDGSRKKKAMDREESKKGKAAVRKERLRRRETGGAAVK